MMETTITQVKEGYSHPRGATWDGNGTNFALFSAHASKVELCIFDRSGEHELERIELPEYTNQIWHGYLPDVHPGTPYGYRVHGPYDPEAGHRFNSNKLLLDPYAYAHMGDLKWNPALFGYVLESGDDFRFDDRDSAPSVPKCTVVDTGFDWSEPCRRRAVSLQDTMPYEVHVRGYTKLHPAIPERLRGTYAGLAAREVVDYIKSLGVTRFLKSCLSRLRQDKVF
jgi:glycogen operon protein